MLLLTVGERETVVRVVRYGAVSRAGTKKRAPEGTRLLKRSLKRYRPVSYYRTILRARRPPATNRAPAPSANSEAPPVGGSAPPAAAEAVPPAAAEAEPPPPPPPPPPAAAVAVVVAVEVAAEAEPAAVLMFTSRPAATLSRHASTWFWLTPSSCAMPASSWSLSTLYWPVAAAWTWSQSTYWTLPPTAVAWAKAGAAAARIMAITAANSITFLNSIPPMPEDYFTCRIFSSLTPNVNTIHRIFYYFLKTS